MVDSHQNIYDLIIQSGHLRGDAVYVFEKAGGEKTICHAKDLFKNITALEKDAFKNIKKSDRILDIGAGGGRISFYLQEKGYDITALEKSKLICRVLKMRGLKKIVNADLFNYFPRKKYGVGLLINFYSIFGKKKEGIIKLLNFVREKILKKGGKFILILNEPTSGKTEIIKRRFIFRGKIGPWFESVHPYSYEIRVLAENKGFLIKNFKIDNYSGQFFLILKKEIKQ